MLRDVTEDDLPVFFEHQCSPVACRMAGFQPRERAAFLLHWRTKVLGNPRGRTKTILVDERVAGYVTSWDDDESRLVAYWIGEEYWGRGIASAALSEFLRGESHRPLRAYVATHNRGSMRVLEKCGFRQAGEAPDGIGEVLFQLGA